jgi:hypothetical protein
MAIFDCLDTYPRLTYDFSLNYDFQDTEIHCRQSPFVAKLGFEGRGFE